MGFEMCGKLPKVDVGFSLILTPTTKKMVRVSQMTQISCQILLATFFLIDKLEKLLQTVRKV